MNNNPDKRDVKELTDELKKVYKYGIKAYGSWDLFKTKGKYQKYLREWIAGTEGSEQERATGAYFGLEDGEQYYNSDVA